MKRLLRFFILTLAVVLAYEICMNAGIAFWARCSTRPLTVVRSTIFDSVPIVLQRNSAASQNIRRMLSRMRMWYPSIVNYAPQVEVYSQRANFHFMDGIMQGGGGTWMPFIPYGGETTLTPRDYFILMRYIRGRRLNISAGD